MPPDFVDLSAHLQRLDVLLSEAGDEAMLLSELDGFLCCVAVSPNPVERGEWWPFEWLTDERGQLKSGNDELIALVEARLAEIERELSQGRYAPLYEVEEESGEVAWQTWLIGFQQAMLLRFEAWDDLLRDTEGAARGEAAMGLASGLMLLQDDVGPDDTAGEEEWAEYDEIVEEMPAVLAHTATLLYHLHAAG